MCTNKGVNIQLQEQCAVENEWVNANTETRVPTYFSKRQSTSLLTNSITEIYSQSYKASN